MQGGNVQSDNLYIYIRLNHLHFLHILKISSVFIEYIIVFQIKYIITLTILK